MFLLDIIFKSIYDIYDLINGLMNVESSLLVYIINLGETFNAQSVRGTTLNGASIDLG